MGFFEELLQKPDEQIIDALKNWVPSRVGPSSITNTIGEYPAEMQQAILEKVKPFLQRIKGLNSDQLGNAEHIATKVAELRGNALRKFFDKVSGTVYNNFSSLPKDTPTSEMQKYVSEMINGTNGVPSLNAELAQGVQQIKGQFNEGLAHALDSQLNTAQRSVQQMEGQLADATKKVDTLKPQVDTLTTEKTALEKELKTARLGFVGKITTSFGAATPMVRFMKGAGMAAGFVAMVDGGRRVLNAVEIDKDTGRIKRNWVKTVLGGAEAAAGATLAGFSAVSTGKFRG